MDEATESSTCLEFFVQQKLENLRNLGFGAHFTESVIKTFLTYQSILRKKLCVKYTCTNVYLFLNVVSSIHAVSYRASGTWKGLWKIHRIYSGLAFRTETLIRELLSTIWRMMNSWGKEGSQCILQMFGTKGMIQWEIHFHSTDSIREENPENLLFIFQHI